MYISLVIRLLNKSRKLAFCTQIDWKLIAKHMREIILNGLKFVK